MKFNSNFYRPNMEATREMAEMRMRKAGFRNFSFKGESRSNGASFYFELEDGREVRVSDHNLTGRREFEVIQISLYEIKKLSPKK